jgi:hypothetical protein
MHLLVRFFRDVANKWGDVEENLGAHDAAEIHVYPSVTMVERVVNLLLPEHEVRQTVNSLNVVDESVKTREDFITFWHWTLDFGSLACWLGVRLILMVQKRVERFDDVIAMLASEHNVIPRWDVLFLEPVRRNLARIKDICDIRCDVWKYEIFCGLCNVLLVHFH